MELFYHRVGQNVAGDAHHFGFGFRPGQAAVERELEILPLADLLQSLISHSLKSTLDGFSLGIQHALLERNVYVSFHGDVDIIRHLVTKLCQATDLAQKCELCVQVGQSVFQHLATAGVLGRLELLQRRLRERRKPSRCRCLAAWSGESACFISAKVGVASACCSSTDLLSQPRAIHKLYAECRFQPLVRRVPAKNREREEEN